MTATTRTGKTFNPVIGIRVEPSVKARMHAAAEREMIPAGTLARIWVIKGLKALEADIRKEIEGETQQELNEIDAEYTAYRGYLLESLHERTATPEAIDVSGFMTAEEFTEGATIRQDEEERDIDRMQEDYETNLLGQIDA